MRAIITGDWHFKGINPRARTDNYQEAITRKIREVYSIAQEHRADIIIVPGDVFDSPGTALGTIADLAALLQDAPCPVLAIPGNHDLWGSNPGSKFRTPFGLLTRLSLLGDLADSPYGPFDDWIITGHGYDAHTDLNMSQFEAPNLEEPIIHVVHSMLLERPPGFDVRHTLIGSVVTQARVIVSGHEHLGFGIHRRKDGVLFINPGALCRLSAHPTEIERQVQVAFLEAEGDRRVEAVLIPLETARPGHEVLSREHLEAQAEREERMNRFLDLLASEGEAKFLEVREIVEDLAKRENLPENVVTEALERIGRAREELAKAGVAA